ncbi:hypothetical protein RH858_08555 [Halalkaliarchaeum sp. AArc-GB]|uniref:hypothetical protein n=1 Tax=Halalkaliarchaeum sp. AArc-GB TaxID=3074078 RepID=UPI002865F9A6|nr:hypothetical protein [Halalkaliarchaeum sp. AArc-GB]MDR5673198.1 hypothetical protein [Halalkaliarchaeum sp. AArc-GB]
MKRRKLLLYGGVAVAGSGTLVGSGAFSSTQVERGVHVSVADDEDAYLALTGGEDGVGLYGADEAFSAPATITVKNQLHTGVTVGIQGSAAGTSVRLDTDDDRDDSTNAVEFEIGIGEAQDVKVDVEDYGTFEVTLDIEATGEGVSIDATRTIDLDNPKPMPEVDSVTFKGGGNAQVSATVQTMDAEVIVLPAGSQNSSDVGDLERRLVDDLDTSQSVRGQLSGMENQNGTGSGNGGRIVAIYFPDPGVTYVHPDYDFDEDELPKSWGGGDGVRKEGDFFARVHDV